MFLVHEKALRFFLRVNSSSISSSKYAASKIFNGPQQFLSFWMVRTYVSSLIVFVVTLTIHYYYCIVALYDVRSGHIVSVRIEPKSKSFWDWSAVIHTIFSASSSSLYVSIGKRPRTCSRISVHYYKTSHDKCRGTNVWPLIGSKFAKTVGS